MGQSISSGDMLLIAILGLVVKVHSLFIIYEGLPNTEAVVEHRLVCYIIRD